MFRLLKNYYYQGPITDHYDGHRFRNLSGEKRTLLDLIKWRPRYTPWPVQIPITTRQVPKPTGLKPVLTFINHSSVLIQWAGKTILVDPIWSERCSPFRKYGPRRVHEPGVSFENLPKIDFVLLTHNHYDHMDLPTIQKIHKEHAPLFLTGLGNGYFLRKLGIKKIYELDWWESFEFFDFNFTYTQAQHFSSRYGFDREWALWGGFAIHHENEYIYITGDTGYGPHFKRVREKLGKPKIAIIPIGAYLPRWFMQPAHICPVEAVQAFLDVEAEQALAVHFGTFQLSDEGHNEPQILLKEALKKQGIEEQKFWVLEPGESRELR